MSGAAGARLRGGRLLIARDCFWLQVRQALQEHVIDAVESRTSAVVSADEVEPPSAGDLTYPEQGREQVISPELTDLPRAPLSSPSSPELPDLP